MELLTVRQAILFWVFVILCSALVGAILAIIGHYIVYHLIPWMIRTCFVLAWR